MALIKCSECGKDISDKALTCPNCGNPLNTQAIQIANTPGQNIHIEPELTSKTWKKVKLWAWGIIVFGFFFGPLLGSTSNQPEAVLYDTIGIMFIGFMVLIVGHIGAWYADKRTR